jgi:hypothetical protein
MCNLCNKLFDAGSATLNELVTIRGEREPEDVTVAQHGIRTATMLLQSVDPEGIRANGDVQELCLTLGAAVERLASLEQSGIPT